MGRKGQKHKKLEPPGDPNDPYGFVKSRLRKPVSLVYVLIYHSGRGRQYIYELLYNGEGQYAEF